MQKWEYYLVLTHLVVLGESRTTPPGKTQTVSRLGLSEQQEEYLDLKVLVINGKRPKSPLFLYELASELGEQGWELVNMEHTTREGGQIVSI